MSVPPARRILVVAPKSEAQPVLSQLRSSGHHVSLVEDLDEADAILGIGGFDQAVLPAASLEVLLAQRGLWEGHDGESWRRSTAGIVHDLRGLLSALGLTLQPGRLHSSGNETLAMKSTIEALSAFAEDLVLELTDRGGGLTPVDLEGAVEAAAVVIYPSAAERSQRLVIEIDDDVAYVNANPSHIKRALKNILEFVSSRAPQRVVVTVNARMEDDDCVIAVSHNGGEITEPEIGRVLSRQLSSRSGRQPLVLARELVEESNGRMWIESEARRVSIFVAIPHSVQQRELEFRRGGSARA